MSIDPVYERISHKGEGRGRVRKNVDIFEKSKSEHNWENVYAHLKEKKIFDLISHNFYI